MSDGEYQVTDPQEWTEMGKDEMRIGNDLPSIKELVRNNYVFFDSYRQGHFYYRLAQLINNGGGSVMENYLFPVPLDDIGTATLLATDKALVFMRWIRRAIEDKTFIKL